MYQCHAWLGATQYSAACQTNIRCTLHWTAGSKQAGREAGKDGGWEGGSNGRVGREGAGGSDEAMM